MCTSKRKNHSHKKKKNHSSICSPYSSWLKGILFKILLFQKIILSQNLRKKYHVINQVETVERGKWSMELFLNMQSNRKECEIYQLNYSHLVEQTATHT